MSEISIQLFPLEEKVNVATHAPGILLGLVGLPILLLKPEISFEHVLAYVVYGLSLTILFSASCLYHFMPAEKNKQLYKKIDHAAIYLFMGGCYTPFVLLNMQGQLKYPFLIVVWLVVAGGILYKFKSKYKTRGLSVIFYLVFGLMCFMVKDQLLNNIPGPSFFALALGGVFYIIGILFYVVRRIPYHHGIWHLFVLLGAMLHFYAVYHT